MCEAPRQYASIKLAGGIPEDEDEEEYEGKLDVTDETFVIPVVHGGAWGQAVERGDHKGKGSSAERIDPDPPLHIRDTPKV